MTNRIVVMTIILNEEYPDLLQMFADELALHIRKGFLQLGDMYATKDIIDTSNAEITIVDTKGKEVELT